MKPLNEPVAFKLSIKAKSIMMKRLDLDPVDTYVDQYQFFYDYITLIPPIICEALEAHIQDRIKMK